MWLKLNLEGIIMSLQIKDYRKTNADNWYETWCITDFSLISEPWLKYMTGGEILLACEVDNLVEELDALLHDRINAPTKISCIEPDFNFVLNPKKDLRLAAQHTYVQPGYEIKDINMEWKTSFWNNGLTANYLSVTLDRSDLESLLVYLRVATGAIKPDAPEVIKKVKQNVIY